ncbi:uncharacterized protein LOC109504486 [Harpegnathos saltator]|uniref:uncharacterized protein LOC109504486 n=1 Tax=Harpegnathos saltator TaxID=610380 RepID=UPI000948CC46|nr:uncharacterized protein LOC109504486 [Harpegnathos saltator]
MVWHVRCLKDAVMPIIWLNCIFCMGVFEIPLHRPRFSLSIIYAVTMVIGYFVLLYNGIVIFEETFNCNLALFYCVVVVNILVATLSIILFWCKSQNFSMLLKRLSLVDDTLEALGVKKNYRKIFCDVLWCMAIWVACMMLLNIMHLVWIWRDNGYLSNLYTALCFGFPIMINSVVDVTFSSLIRCIKSKFRYTNILINNIVLSTNNENVLKIHNKPKDTPVAIVTSNYKNNKDMIKHLLQTLK